MKSKSFIISCLNVQGLGSSAFGLKSRAPDFLRELGGADVFISRRLGVEEMSPLVVPATMSPSTKLKGGTQGRDSGGMLIWFKANLVQYVELIKKGEFSIWLKIKKDPINTDKDVFLCAAYIPPSEAPYFNEDRFSILEDEISYFQGQGSVPICGDLNARAGTEPDFISTQGDKHKPGPISIPLPSQPHRNNFDKTVQKKRTPAAAAMPSTGCVHG